MNLTEGQLFTIEALNRIEGFVWPKHASHAFMNENERFVSFTSGRRPDVVVGVERCMYVGIFAGSASAGCKHPDWRKSLITREQFDSVDGWVRNDGSEPVSGVSGYCCVDVKHENGIIDLGFSSDGYEWDWKGDNEYRIVAWRYHKPTKETEMQPESPKKPSIDELYSQHKTQRGIVEIAKKTLADEMEAEDKLLEQIKAWNLEHGFDVRLLDESEEKPELVITDWRDLRVGDVVLCNGITMTVDNIVGDILIAFRARSETGGLFAIYHGTWKFIRRQSK